MQAAIDTGNTLGNTKYCVMNMIEKDTHERKTV